jgi:bifunctional non-homologous end joining protein LigD
LTDQEKDGLKIDGHGWQVSFDTPMYIGRGTIRRVGSSKTTVVSLGKRQLALSNLDKVLYPTCGFTKGQVIEYYAKVAPVLLPHLRGRAITLKRFPDGVSKYAFFSKNLPKGAPDWFSTTAIEGTERTINYCLIEDIPSLAWVANLAALELHVPLERAHKPDVPTAIVFDLDPGPPAGLLECAKLALRLQQALAGVGLQAFVKTSGRKGLHVMVPLNTGTVPFSVTSQAARAMALVLARDDPKGVTVTNNKAERTGKVFIDWTRNAAHQTAAGAYSLRANEEPTVSTPLAWEELELAVKKRDTTRLIFTAAQVVERAAAHGDLFAPVLTLKQRLPR